MYQRNSNGTYNFHGVNIMPNGTVPHPLQILAANPTLPWYYTAQSAPANVRSVYQPVLYTRAQPYNFVNNGR